MHFSSSVINEYLLVWFNMHTVVHVYFGWNDRTHLPSWTWLKVKILYNTHKQIPIEKQRKCSLNLIAIRTCADLSFSFRWRIRMEGRNSSFVYIFWEFGVFLLVFFSYHHWLFTPMTAHPFVFHSKLHNTCLKFCFLFGSWFACAEWIRSRENGAKHS